MLECNNRFEDRAFLLLLAGVSLAFLWMLRPFFDVIFWGIVIALLSTPVYDALQRRSMGRNLAALTCVILSLVLIIVPCAYIFYTFINEVANLYGRLTSGGHDIRETLEKLREVAPGVQDWLTRYGYGPEVITQKLSELAVKVSGLVARNTVALGGSTVNFLVDLCIMLYLAFFLVRDGKQLRVLLIRALPFGDHREDLLFAKFAEVLRATVKGSLLVAMAQGALGGLIFWVLGIKAPVLWGVVMTLLSLIPVVARAWSGRRWPGTCCSRATMCPAWCCWPTGSSSSVWRTTSSAPSWWGAIPSCRTSWSCSPRWAVSRSSAWTAS